MEIMTSKKIQLEDLRAYAVEQGGTCKSASYTGIRSMYDWECSEGHD
jgi:hypothetical protein